MTTPFGGYTCNGCGLWVQNGSVHSCVRYGLPVAAAQPTPIPVTIIAGVTEERVREIVNQELDAREQADKRAAQRRG